MTKINETLKFALNALREPLFIYDSKLSCLFANDALYSFLCLDAGANLINVNQFWPAVSEAKLGEEFSSEFRVHDQSFAVKVAVKSLPDGTFMGRVVAGVSKRDALYNLHAQR